MRKLLLITLFLLCASVAWGAPAVLNFSDLADGTRTGNGDGTPSSDHGVIVTVWGNNLGTTQGTSKIYIGNPSGTYVETTYYHYWKNADGTLPGGPSDMYSRHKMQEVAFVIPTTAPTGAQKIWAVVDGLSSNTLDFYVRNTGNIRFIKTTGSDSNTGTWASPWRTLGHAATSLSAGDIAYVNDGVYDSSGVWMNVDGSINNLRYIVAYPNSRGGTNGITMGVGYLSGPSPTGPNADGTYHWAEYNGWAKLVCRASANTMSGSAYGRVIGNDASTGSYATGNDGMVGGAGTIRDTKFYGNYLHDQNATTNNQSHSFYVTIRCTQNGSWHPCSIPGSDIGWNYLKNNGGRFGMHFYDEHGCGSYTTPMYVHHNYVENQTGAGFDIGVGACDSGYSMDSGTQFYVYDNVFDRCGKDNSLGYGRATALSLWGNGNYSNVKVYNNTFYNYSGATCGDLCPGALNVPSGGNRIFMGTWEYKNNIVVDAMNQPYINTTEGGIKTPTASSNNLWYSTVNNAGLVVPAWDTSPLNVNPLFTNAGNQDFSLQAGSPAKDTGVVLGTVLTDLIGIRRPFQGVTYDIGAFEYDASGGGSDTTPPTVTEFIIPSTSSSLTVSITTFTATDNVAVTGYCLLPDNAVPPTASTCWGSGWSSSPQTQYIFPVTGSHTLYSYAKDAAGNISSTISRTVVITLPPPSGAPYLRGVKLRGAKVKN